MTSVSERRLQIGGDPRSRADYAALRDELHKLTHPARPDVNWTGAEKCCLSLFEQNGAELQTAAWYTLIRAHLAGLSGMNEGLSLLETLITRHWGNVWPPAAHARLEILNTLARRLQQYLRTLTLNYAQLSALYQAEKHLIAAGDALQRLELKHLSGLEPLREQLHQAAVRLENSSGTADTAGTSPVVLPATAVPPRETVDDAPSRQRWRVLPAPVPHIHAVPAPGSKPWKPFAAGMLTMLVAGALIWGGARYLTGNPEQAALMATVAPLPAPLSSDALRRQPQDEQPDDAQAEVWFAGARQQLDVLSRLSPVWSLNYGSGLVSQAQTLWPDRPETVALTRQWQTQLTTTAAPADSGDGWQQGMTQLQQLTRRLNGLDEQRGKYMTVSELKSQIFAITQAFNQTVPAEEQLRRLAAQPASVPVPAALRTQTELHLKQLLARYALLTTPQEGSHVTP